MLGMRIAAPSWASHLDGQPPGILVTESSVVGSAAVHMHYLLIKLSWCKAAACGWRSTCQMYTGCSAACCMCLPVVHATLLLRLAQLDQTGPCDTLSRQLLLASSGACLFHVMTTRGCAGPCKAGLCLGLKAPTLHQAMTGRDTPPKLLIVTAGE